MGEELVLDPAIRDWVLIPIVVIMFLVGILRNNVMKMMRKETVRRRTNQPLLRGTPSSHPLAPTVAINHIAPD